jgi:DNA-binding CsgD family transcriptional regulator
MNVHSLSVELKLVSDLYKAASHLHVSQVRPWALKALDRVAPFDAAIWATGTRTQRLEVAWRDAIITGLSAEFTQELAEHGSQNPLLGPALADTAAPVYGCFRTENLPLASRRHYERHGIRGGSYVHYVNPPSHVVHVIAAFTFDPGPAREVQLQRALECVAHAMVDATSFCFSKHLSGGCGLDGRKYAAICDSADVIIEAQPGFTGLLRKHFTGWDGRRLPFRASTPSACPRQERPELLSQVEPLEQLRVVRLWEPSELDDLTRRELELISFALQRWSDKEIAAKTGLSVSTVSNRLVGAFRKLDVSSRQHLRNKYQDLADVPAPYSFGFIGKRFG